MLPIESLISAYLIIKLEGLNIGIIKYISTYEPVA